MEPLLDRLLREPQVEGEQVTECAHAAQQRADISLHIQQQQKKKAKVTSASALFIHINTVSAQLETEPEICPPLWDITGHHKTSQDITEHHRTSKDITGHHRLTYGFKPEDVSHICLIVFYFQEEQRVFHQLRRRTSRNSNIQTIIEYFSEFRSPQKDLDLHLC